MSTTDLTNVTLNVTPPTTNDSVADGGFTWEKALIGTVLVILVLVTLFGNILVLVAVAKEKRLQTVFNLYIVNLAVTDTAVAATAMSFYAIDMMLGYWPFGEFMCGVWIFCDYGMTFASVFTLLVISIDRFWSVSWIHHYRTHHTKKKALALIAAVWVVMLCLWLPPCTLDRISNWQEGLCLWEPSKNREFVIVIAVIGHHGSFAILLFCYVRVFIFMQKRAKTAPPGSRHPRKVGPAPTSMQVHCISKVENSTYLDPNVQPQSEETSMEELSECRAGTSANGTRTQAASIKQKVLMVKSADDNSDSANDKRERKAFLTLTYILAGYVVCWLPFHVVFDVSAVNPDLVPMPLYLTTFWMTYVNSTINPILYNFSSLEFRKAFKKIICRR